MSARNPILPGVYPDPSVCQVGEYTYLVNSTFTWLPGLPIHRSKDLVTWELCGHALTTPDVLDLNKGEESQGIFAPTLRYIDERFVLVCTTVVGDTQRSFLMTAREASGPWSPPRFLEGAGGIDPDIFQDDDGTVWWTGTRLAASPLWEQQTEIWTRPVDLDTATFTGEETVIWHGAVEGVVWSEGPHIYRRGDWYYLLTAEGGTAEEHAVSIARAHHVRGPWEGCKRNPIFSHRNLGRRSQVHNVGHADLVQRHDGTWWAVMLGVRLRHGHHLLGRETFLAPVTWEDDWPVIAPGVGHLTAAVDTRSGVDPYHRSLSEATLPYTSLQQHEMKTSVTAFRECALRPVGVQWCGAERSFRGVRAATWNSAISVRAHDFGEALTAIGIVQDAHNWARIEMSDEAMQVRIRRGGKDEVLHLPTPGHGQHLWVVLDDLTLRLGVGPHIGYGFCHSINAQWLSTESAGGFTGCLLGIWGEDASKDTASVYLRGTHPQL